MFDRYLEVESTLAALQAVFVMLGAGVTLSLRDFVSIFRQPRSFLVGIACQFILAPSLTMAAIYLFGLEPGIAIGLILICAMPAGPLANLFTILARGNIALSVTLTGVGTVGSLVTAPLLFHFLAKGLVPEEVVMPVEAVVADVALFLLAPLGMGMLIGRFAPSKSTGIAAWLARGSLLILITMIVGSLGSGRIVPMEHGWKTPLVIVGLCLAVQNLSMLPFLLFRWRVADQTAIGIGTTIRNINLALLLSSRLFPATTGSQELGSLGAGVFYVVLFWGALSMIVCTPTIFVQRRALAREAARRTSTDHESPIQNQAPLTDALSGAAPEPSP